MIGHINVSWVSPVRFQTRVSSAAPRAWCSTTYRTLREDQDLRQGGRSTRPTERTVYHLKVQYRVGDMHAPKLEDHEALALETRHFAELHPPRQGALDRRPRARGGQGSGGLGEVAQVSEGRRWN